MPSIWLCGGFGWLCPGWPRGAFPTSRFRWLRLLPSAFLCQGALSKTRAFLARFLVYTAKPGGWLTCRCAASASATFCPRRRCLAGGSPVQPRRISHVDRVTYCGCVAYGQILVLLA